MKFNDERYAKILVFYRELPSIIETHTSQDGRMSIVKDGVKSFGQQSCPRVTIFVDSVNAIKDKKRLEELSRLLENLESNNQIIAFKIKKPGVNQ